MSVPYYPTGDPMKDLPEASRELIEGIGKALDLPQLEACAVIAMIYKAGYVIAQNPAMQGPLTERKVRAIEPVPQPVHSRPAHKARKQA